MLTVTFQSQRKTLFNFKLRENLDVCHAGRFPSPLPAPSRWWGRRSGIALACCRSASRSSPC